MVAIVAAVIGVADGSSRLVVVAAVPVLVVAVRVGVNALGR